MPAAVAAMAPMKNWPSAPMLNWPAENTRETARPVNVSGTAASKKAPNLLADVKGPVRKYENASSGFLETRAVTPRPMISAMHTAAIVL